VIRGRLLAVGGRPRPYVTGRLTIPSQAITGEVNFLIDTGADSTLLAPADALALGVDIGRLPTGPTSMGVGGHAATVRAEASLTLYGLNFPLDLRILVPGSPRQQAALTRIPSLIGRDVLSHFALFFEERTARVLLLTPQEAAALVLP